MAYDQSSRPRRNTNDSRDIHLNLSRMPNSGDSHYPARHSEFNNGRRSYVPPSVQDEYNEDERPIRTPSPPMSDTSNAPSTEQQTGLSDEVIAHLTERIKKEVVEHFKQSGNIDNITENSKGEAVRNVERADDQPRSDKSSSTPSPPPYCQKVYTPPSPNVGAKRSSITSNSPPLSLVTSPPDSPTAEKPSVHFKKPRDSGDKEEGRHGRPTATRSSFSSAELSTIDLKWGKLFDGDSQATLRLRQVLRGVANHIIGEFQPRQSIVVTPDKMAAFYENYAVDGEVHPLTTIFKSQCHENLSDLYQELECQHHLVQEEPFTKPMIPGLTPDGFAQWMITWIQAFPDQESKRMQNVVVGMPIDADGETVDGKPERLPKAISRHLFPSREHLPSRMAVHDTVSTFLKDLETSRARNPSIASPQMVRRASTSMQSKVRPIDIPQISPPNRGREKDPMPYSKPPSDAGFLREPATIERRRQLYTAKPGSGKVFVENLAIPNATRSERANSTGRILRDHEPEPEYRPRHIRTHSNAGNRPSGSLRASSPPMQNYSQSNSSNLEAGEFYLSDKYSSPPKLLLSPTSSYTTNKYPPSSSETRERDRYADSRRSERRSANDGPRSRRNTLNDSAHRPLDITIPRNTERWDQTYENRDKSRDRDRDRDRKFEPKSAGPILHQEFRPEVRTPMSDSPDEAWYLRSAAPPAARGGEY